jgi:hypothetical protein
VYGIILVKNEKVYDLVEYDERMSVSEIAELYEDWHPQNFEHFYISPGIIELNVRQEWESIQNLTKSAVSCGTTFVLVEQGFHNKNEKMEEIYCDVGYLSSIDASNYPDKIKERTGNVFGYKCYLSPPCDTVGSVEGCLDEILDKLESSKLPLFIDPVFIPTRLLHLNSPWRTSKLEARLHDSIPENLNLLVGAIAMNSSDAVSAETSERTFTSRTSSKHSTISADRSMEYLQAFNNRRNIKFLSNKVPDQASTPVDHSKQQLLNSKNKKLILKIQGKFTMIEDLEERIQKSLESIEELSLAEQNTYSEAGSTLWNQDEVSNLIKTHEFSINIIPAADYDTEETESTGEIKGKYKFRPKRLDCLSIVKKCEEESNYLVYLANNHENWEINGVKRIIRALKKKPHKVHITNMSSASAVSKARKFKSKSKILTCETTMNHLYFTNSMIKTKETLYKAQPPIKNHTNSNFLWELLKLNVIDSISSFHACIDSTYKFKPYKNFKRALNGINCLGFSLPAIWTKLRFPVTSDSLLDNYIVRLSKWLSLNPAKIIGLDKHRGSIEKHKFADLIIWDPYEASENYPYSCPETAVFHDLRLSGRISRVYVRGRLVFNEGDFIPAGKFTDNL